MKTLISEYGSMIIAVLVGIAVLGIILYPKGKKAGILEIAEEVVEIQTKDFLQVQDHTVYDSFLKQSNSLKISYVEEKPIYAGEIIDLKEHFVVTDESGSAVSYEMSEIYDHLGNSCYGQVVLGSGKLLFSNSGVYQILIETRRKNTRNSSAIIAFPVKGKSQQK